MKLFLIMVPLLLIGEGENESFYPTIGVWEKDGSKKNQEGIPIG